MSRRTPTAGTHNTGDSSIMWSSPLRDAISAETKFLQELWDDTTAAALAGDPLQLLRYRSNLLGADLRITNFGGGNTSSKFELPDAVTGELVRVRAGNGSGGELRSIDPCAILVLDSDLL